MESELKDIAKFLSEKGLNFLDKLWFFVNVEGYIYSFRLVKVLHLVTPIIVTMIVYQYLKHLLIYNAFQYEEFVRKKYERIKKVNKHLKVLAKRYGNLYFCYLPLNHGTALPRTYTLFMAIKDVLTNADRPAPRALRINLLLDLLQANQTGIQGLISPVDLTERGYFDVSPNEVDPLSEFNLDIMKCSRELIIQGVKDFDTMSTVYRVLEIVEDTY